MMRNSLLAFAAAILLASGADADRACGSANASSTYQWRLGAARYDGPEPGDSNGSATVAFSIVPGSSTMGTFFECVAEWPESWQGWYEDGNIIWSDCIWAGNGRTYDTAVSFATDWKNRTLYISHTFPCSDAKGTDALATGSVQLDLDCTDSAEDGSSCTLKGNGQDITTKGSPARLAADSCTDNSQRYQSWQLENWQRQYEAIPGSTAGPQSDTGPSFVLRNMANTDVFNCSPSGNQNSTFEGTCLATAEGSSTTSATFSFDPKIDVLIINQHWNCSETSLFDATGVGYVQATCNREGNLLTCTSDPLWIGTKIV
ncbi:uncharacterized protein F4822DRAFT_360675 [Hypoxylon trugodes]|uniref:uncharacterized protein n=1 Tax=Hypoxylon trugodes TaxID=326681 RepID=UPI002198B523|nr:uncharacterized protein F4822DRAFT_360675 [Hypoxylon trugodes]KAI1386027.1 hypothetical protein F4822DRAFT_360675 [Hypoxylon trugodes]